MARIGQQLYVEIGVGNANKHARLRPCGLGAPSPNTLLLARARARIALQGVLVLCEAAPRQEQLGPRLLEHLRAVASMPPQFVLGDGAGLQDDQRTLVTPIADLSVYQTLRDQAPDNVPIFGISDATPQPPIEACRLSPAGLE